jgi:hypothetical protein
MNRTQFLIALTCVLLGQSLVLAQTSDLPRYEIAGEFTAMERIILLGELK